MSVNGIGLQSNKLPITCGVPKGSISWAAPDCFSWGAKGGKGQGMGADISHENNCKITFFTTRADHCGRYDLVFSTVNIINKC